jgi:hypothetical protein
MIPLMFDRSALVMWELVGLIVKIRSEHRR